MGFIVDTPRDFLYQWQPLQARQHFSILLSKNGSDYRPLELDEVLIDDSFSIRFSETKEKKIPCMLEICSIILPDRFYVCLPIYLTMFTHYQFWATDCARPMIQLKTASS